MKHVWIIYGIAWAVVVVAFLVSLAFSWVQHKGIDILFGFVLVAVWETLGKLLLIALLAIGAILFLIQLGVWIL